MKSTQIWIIVGLVAVIWAFALIAQGQRVPLDYLKAFSYAVSGVSLALLLWERWLWSWWIFHPWLTTRPDLRGTWKGTLESSWTDPAAKRGHGTVEIYLVIRQTYSALDVRMLTAESSSASLIANIIEEEKGVYSLAVVYRNTPRVLLRHRSPISHGGAILSVRGTPAHQLDGEYWTDRNTKGEITLTGLSDAQFHDFEQASKAKYHTAAHLA